MQRLFSMFPTGAPGIALLLLRLCVAGTLLWIGIAYYTLWSPWFTAAAVALATGLFLGLLTPYCACLCCLIEVRAAILPGPEADILRVLPIVHAIVVAMIGPGAYSLDSHLFGRQLLTLPPRKMRGLH